MNKGGKKYKKANFNILKDSHKISGFKSQSCNRSPKSWTRTENMAIPVCAPNHTHGVQSLDHACGMVKCVCLWIVKVKHFVVCLLYQLFLHLHIWRWRSFHLSPPGFGLKTHSHSLCPGWRTPASPVQQIEMCVWMKPHGRTHWYSVWTENVAAAELLWWFW